MGNGCKFSSAPKQEGKKILLPSLLRLINRAN